MYVSLELVLTCAALYQPKLQSTYARRSTTHATNKDTHNWLCNKRSFFLADRMRVDDTVIAFAIYCAADHLIQSAMRAFVNVCVTKRTIYVTPYKVAKVHLAYNHKGEAFRKHNTYTNTQNLSPVTT